MAANVDTIQNEFGWKAITGQVDIDAARAADVAVVAVSYGYTLVPASELGADAIIDTLSDLPETLARLTDRDQIAFRYCDAFGEPVAAANPNGSLRNIAGVYNETKTILGLMPHPERLADPALGGTDGAAMFQGLVEALS